MADSINILGLSLPDSTIQDDFAKDDLLAKYSLQWIFTDAIEADEALEKKIRENNICIAAGEVCLKMDKIVKHRSVGSHFFNYIDFIINQDGKLWGESLFTKVFLDIFLGAIQNQDFKGSVIFLGSDPVVLPTLEVLARFGFEDFVFLELDESTQKFDQYQKYLSGLLNTNVSKVDSTAFIRSQKEYSFCFVMEDLYSQQTLEDMSYFHFLSANSIVFDLAGNSNFLFKEVKALGVNVISYELVAVALKKHIAQNILKHASKMS